ncbi:MAG: hypothetical protein AAFY56_09300 [Pseudomonadota bacterium]
MAAWSKPRRRKPGALRVVMRRARGVKVADIARECRLEVEDVESWLRLDAFEGLVSSCRALMECPVEERLKKLELEALDLLEIAVQEGDVRVALFLADQFARQKNPARVLAEAVNRKVAQSTIPLDQPLSKPRPPAPDDSKKIDPATAKRAAAIAYNLRPWAGAISKARQELSADLIRAFPSNVETPSREDEAAEQPQAILRQDKKPSPAPGMFPRTPATITDLLTNSATSSLALLTSHPNHHSRDGP